MIAPRLWCRTCRHHLSSHRLKDDRGVCIGCDSRQGRTPIPARLVKDNPLLPKSFHEYRGANAFLLWLWNAKVEWWGIGLVLVPLVILMIVGRWF